MNTRNDKIRNLRDAIDAARIAHKLDDVHREVAFVVDVTEWLHMCRASLTHDDRAKIRCMIRGRSYDAALKHLELNA